MNFVLEASLGWIYFLLEEAIKQICDLYYILKLSL